MKVFLRWTNQSVFWVAIALLCYALLPAFALDYGIFEATADERHLALVDAADRPGPPGSQDR